MDETAQISAINRWVLNHDDCKIFFVFYIGLSVLLSITLGLFWLLVIVLAHFALDVAAIKGRGRSWSEALKESLWALKLDFTLVIFALAIAVYMDVVFGFVGLSHGARATVQAGSRIAHSGTRTTAGVVKAGARMAGWQKALRPILLSLDDAVHCLKAFWRNKICHLNDSTEIVEKKEVAKIVSKSMLFADWTKGDIATMIFAILLVFSLVAAPFFTNKSFVDVWQLIQTEMNPY